MDTEMSEPVTTVGTPLAWVPVFQCTRVMAVNAGYHELHEAVHPGMVRLMRPGPPMSPRCLRESLGLSGEMSNSSNSNIGRCRRASFTCKFSEAEWRFHVPFALEVQHYYIFCDLCQRQVRKLCNIELGTPRSVYELQAMDRGVVMTARPMNDDEDLVSCVPTAHRK